MAGGLNNKYSDIGKDILSEMGMKDGTAALATEGADPAMAEHATESDEVIEQMANIAEQLIQSNMFENTPDGIRGAYREAAKRVYQDTAEKMEPSQLIRGANKANKAKDIDTDLRSRDMQRDRKMTKRRPEFANTVEERKPLPRK